VVVWERVLILFCVPYFGVSHVIVMLCELCVGVAACFRQGVCIEILCGIVLYVW